MPLSLRTPTSDAVPTVLQELRSWQHDDGPWQLHPGDIGWYGRFGAQRTAEAIRVWERDGRTIALGLLDGPGLIRLTMAPDHLQDPELAQQLRRDLTDPAYGVANGERFCVESPAGAAVRDVLTDDGWVTDEPWQPLRRDLSTPVDWPAEPNLRIEYVGADQVTDWVSVNAAAFDAPAATADRWHHMVSGPAFSDAHPLVAYDAAGAAVATIIAWSAGAGRPGVIEPMGVHPHHRGHGYGTAICVAAASALQRAGSSSAVVYTLADNAGGVATYQAAGFTARPQVHDQYLPASS